MNILLTLFIFIISIIIIYYVYINHINEGYVDYVQAPYNYMKTGADPLYFYRKDRYRKPYDDGFRFFKSYPLPHLEMRP